MRCGIFVGGGARRMGGIAKGLLPIAGEPVVVRLVRVAREAGLDPAWVGLREHADAYRQAVPGLPEIADAAQEVGPLAGLAGLLANSPRAIALACDMPFVSSALLVRLRQEKLEATVLAPCFDGRWEPLCARYDAAITPAVLSAIASGTHSFQRLFAALPVEVLALDTRDELSDWDAPEDVR